MQTIAMLTLEGSSTFTPPTLCIIFGGLMLGIAIIGGGVKAKEIEIPALNVWMRILAGFFGVSLLWYGLAISSTSTAVNKPEPGKADQPGGLKADEAHLSPLNCTSINAVRSGDPGDETTILFANETTSPVHLFWIDYDGKRQPWANLSAKNMYNDHVRLKTFEHHAWLVEDDRGACLELFVAPAQDTIATISTSIKDF